MGLWPESVASEVLKGVAAIVPAAGWRIER
jgi:hypothetical protein